MIVHIDLFTFVKPASVYLRSMTSTGKSVVTIETTVNAPVEKVWHYFTAPEHISQWNAASDDWFTPSAENDLRENGTFLYRMEAKDKSFGLNFSGVYQEVKPHALIRYTLVDGRTVSITFEQSGTLTKVVEVFEPEQVNPIETQQTGWQSILNRFKDYTENTGL